MKYKFTWDVLKRHAAKRPDGYLDELVAIAIEKDTDGVVFDINSDEYKKLMDKYAEHRQRDKEAKNIVYGSRDLKKLDFTELDSLSDDKLTERMISAALVNIQSNAALKTSLTYSDMFGAMLPVLSSLTGEIISVERQRKRLFVCSKCPLLSIIDDKPACGVCGCQLHVANKSVINLVKREEKDSYGCKHPDGSMWKANGV